jgi:dTDP-glucose 4,6-dehydratase
LKILVTGGAGFIGSNFVRMALRRELTLANIETLIVLDKLTYAGTLENLADVLDSPNLEFIHGDICDLELVTNLARKVDLIINFAAESHVDNSIENSSPFIHTNITGVHCLLEAVRLNPKTQLIQISTDEVYGSISKGSWNESSPLEPNSPYAASKAAGDLLIRAYCNTYKLDVRITRCANNYGPYQNPEKAIPNFINKLLHGRNIELYGDGTNRREWIHVSDHCRAIALVAKAGVAGEIYNVPAEIELSNLELAQRICNILNLPFSRINFITDRLGHDKRYSLNGYKIEHELQYKPNQNFDTGIQQTINWYKNQKKLNAI